jgi:hypothetical protein
MGAELFHADITKIIVAFRGFTKALKDGLRLQENLRRVEFVYQLNDCQLL